MSEGYEEKGLEKAQNSRSTIRSRLTADIGRFCLYDPPVPNMQLPQEPTCVNFRFAQERQVATAPASPDSKGALLTRNESHAMSCCFGRKFRFKKVRLGSQKSQIECSTSIISHSAESGILRDVSRKKEVLEIPQSVEDEVPRLFAVDESSGSSDDDGFAKGQTRGEVSDSSDQEDSDGPCAPLSLHLIDDSEKPPTQRNFLSDDDQTHQSFLSDEDEEEVLPILPTGLQENKTFIDIGSDSDDLPPPPKKPQIFLDSDEDADFLVVS
jgi:hypothetical protein